MGTQRSPKPLIEALEDELKDYVRDGLSNDALLNRYLVLYEYFIKDKMLPLPGSVLDQPTFFMDYVVPWIGAALKVKASMAVPSLIEEEEMRRREQQTGSSFAGFR